MPLPFAYFAAIGSITLATGLITYYGIDGAGNAKEILEKEYNDLKDGGVRVIAPIAAEIGEGLEDLGDSIVEGLEAIGAGFAAAGNSLLDFIRGLGIAVLQGASDTVNYIIAETKEFRVPLPKLLLVY